MVDSLSLRRVAPWSPIFPHHGSLFASTAPPTPTPGSIASPRPAVERAPSLQRTTATCERDSRTASQTTSARVSRRNARAAIRSARGGTGRLRSRCDSTFFDSLIVAVAITSSPAALPSHPRGARPLRRSEEHTSELQSHHDLVCRLLLEKKKKKHMNVHYISH